MEIAAAFEFWFEWASLRCDDIGFVVGLASGRPAMPSAPYLPPSVDAEFVQGLLDFLERFIGPYSIAPPGAVEGLLANRGLLLSEVVSTLTATLAELRMRAA